MSGGHSRLAIRRRTGAAEERRKSGEPMDLLPAPPAWSPSSSADGFCGWCARWGSRGRTGL